MARRTMPEMTADQRDLLNRLTSLHLDYTTEQNQEILVAMEKLLEDTRRDAAGQLEEAKTELVRMKTGRG